MSIAAAESGGPKSQDVTKSKDGGVLKTILKQGEDRGVHPAKGDGCYVHYVGTIKDTGKVFDSSRERNQPFFFSLGKGQVIKGWDLGVATMCRGELARLECREDYAYGASGSPPKIPGGATLIFEVELLRWEGEDLSPDRDGSITKSVIVLGEKFANPTEHAGVKVHAVGADANGRVFFDRDLDYVLGEGLEQGLPDGIDKALKRINKGEKCRVTLKGKFGYGMEPPPEYGLKPNEEVVFTVFLKSYEKVKASWEMMDEEKLEHAQGLKDRGTEFLNAGKYPLALNKYAAIIHLMEFAKPTKGPDEGGVELGEKYQLMFIAAQLNSALAYLRMGETIEAIKCCDKVLEKRPDHVKALYRKAQALQQRRDYDEAVQIYARVEELEPGNKAAAQAILNCRQELRNENELQRKKFKGMFEKLAKEADGTEKTGKENEKNTEA